jgi:chromosome partitioning protein
MGTVIGLVSQKGGVGKTTAALNLAAELTRRGRKVAVLDADPVGAALAVAEDGRLSFPVEPHLLDDLEPETVSSWMGALERSDAEFIIIDSPGALGEAFGATIAVSDLVLVPSGATVLDMRGAAETVGRVRRDRRSRSGRPDILIVPSRVDRRTAAGREIVTMLAGLTEPVGPVISYRTAVADSLAMGETVPQGSDSAQEFAALANAVLTRLGESND